MNSSYVFQINLDLEPKLKELLFSLGLSFQQPAHTIYQAKKKGLTVTLYQSGKLVVQGKESLDFIQSYLEPQILQTFTVGYEYLSFDLTPRIGVDESGKGDFFGPLCVAGVFAQNDEIKKLAEIGVKDSKRLTDSSILKIADKIKKDFFHHIVKIGPKKYNELYDKFKNLNHLLGWGHATVIDYLLDKSPPCKKIVIDQFAGEYVVENALKKKNRKDIELHQRPRAEEDLVVAGASILARASFITELHFIGKNLEIELPKGASKKVIEVGKQVVAKFGPDVLNHVAKAHFKTQMEILR